MDKDEALKLALEALNTPRPTDSYPPLWRSYEKTINDAITALKQALAADVREPVATLFGSLPVYETPPVKEPVAWLVYAKGSRKYFTLTFDPNKVPEIYIGGEAVPLYTTLPAAQRQWMGLTDEEIFSVLGNLQRKYNGPPTEDSRVVFALAIETKLKEKNT
jgi:hypothetical protein